MWDKIDKLDEMLKQTLEITEKMLQEQTATSKEFQELLEQAKAVGEPFAELLAKAEANIQEAEEAEEAEEVHK